jgi:hypothetical protein
MIMKKINLISLAIYFITSAACFGYQKGDILSHFSFGEDTAPFGIDVREMSGGTELHAITGSGQVYQMGINDVSAIKDGSEGTYNSKNMMMNSNASGFRSLSINRWYQGQGWKYNAFNTTRILHRSIWDYPEGNEVGSMEWTSISGAWQMLSSGDIAPTAREKLEGAWPEIWTVYNGEVSGVQYNSVFRYPDAPWTGRYDFTKEFNLGKALQGVSLGYFNDTDFRYDNLWVLCEDGEILNISSDNGDIIDRFYLDSQITNYWGIAYDPSEKSLWISSTNSLRFYQVATEDAPWRNADFDQDGVVDISDLKIFVSEWLHCTDPDNSECDQYYK